MGGPAAPSKIIWIYSKYYKDYHEVLNRSDLDIEFSPEFDYNAVMNRIEMDTEGNHFLLVLDDILQCQQQDLDIIFTR